MSAYAVTIEGAEDSYSGYVPDLPGCLATGRPVQEVEELPEDAIRLHIASLRSHAERLPEPTTAAVRNGRGRVVH